MMKDIYDKAKQSADQAIRSAVLKKEYPYLKALDEIIGQTGTVKTVHLGIIDVPAELIVGTKTKGRQNMFARNFMPAADRYSEFAAKWTRVYNHQNEEGIDDPVLLYEYRHLFYVQEGNKRVSVMKFLKTPVITAEVIRLEDEEEDPLYTEFLAFFRCTGLYELNFTERGGYRRLAEIYGRDLSEKWDDETIRQLKASWYIFRKQFEREASEEDLPYCSDIFLLFLNVFGKEELRTAGAAAVRDSVKKAIKDYADSRQKKTIRLMRKPEKEKSTLIDLRKMIPSGIRRAAFIHDGDPAVSSAVFDQELGRLIVSEKYKDRIRTEAYFGGGRDAIEEAAENSDVLFTTSPKLLEETFRCAVRHPEKKYYNCSLYKSRNTVNTYAVRMYEVKFLMGVLAAVLCENHLLGYIAGDPENSSAADINAFAVGAAMVDPRAVVYLGWNDMAKEDLQERMRQKEIRIFSGSELPSFEKGSTEFGLYRIDGSEVVNIAAPVMHWDRYYDLLLQRMLARHADLEKDKAVSFWWGMSEGVADISVSERLPYASRKLMRLLKNRLIQDTLSPFEGELHSQTGMIQGEDAGRLSDEEIIGMNWLNDNVIGSLPDCFQKTDGGSEGA